MECAVVVWIIGYMFYVGVMTEALEDEYWYELLFACLFGLVLWPFLMGRMQVNEGY